MDEIISVIVPVYNVEKYLSRCLNSLINQTYEKLEIILIDDGSTDQSGCLCDEYSRKDKRIKVFHKKNGGLSSARNLGLKYASGNYISFVDSDDWLMLDTYEYMMKLICEKQADVVQCGFCRTNKNIKVPKIKEQIKEYYNKDVEQYYMKYSTKTGSYSVWKFLYKKELIEEIKFREGKINEDIDFNYKVLSKCKKLIVSNQTKYFYFQEGNSLSTGGLKERDFDLYDAAEELYKLTRNENYGTIRKLACVKKARTSLSLLCKIAFYGVADTNINQVNVVMKLKKELRKNAFILLVSPIPFSRKILTVMFCLSYRMSENLIRSIKKYL